MSDVRSAMKSALMRRAAEKAYEAFREKFRRDPTTLFYALARWDQLDLRWQESWIAAAQAAIDEVTR